MGRFDSTLQQICPDGQQNVPQQVPVVHVWPAWSVHAGVATHVPLLQKGVDPEQALPQVPQLKGSL